MNFVSDPILALQHEVQELRTRNQLLEQELCALQAHYASFLDYIPIGLSVIRGFTILYCNKAWKHMFAVPDDSCCIDRSPLDFIASHALPELLHQIGSFHHLNPTILHIRSHGKRCDNSTFPLLITISNSQWSPFPGFISIVQDISSQVHAELELQASIARYLAVFNNNTIGISIVDSSGAFIEVNIRYASYFGYSPEEILTVQPLMLIHPESRSNTQGLLQRLFNKEISHYTMEKRYLRKDGSSFWGHVFVSPILDATGFVLQAVCLVIDITARKKAEQSLAQLNMDLESLVLERTKDLTDKALALENANQALQRLDDLKTSFLSSVSHELRTPLTSIFGFTKLIHKDFVRHFIQFSANAPDLRDKATRIVQNLHIIEQEGKRLSRLVNDVLDLHKMESGQMQWRPSTVSVRECLYEAILAVGGYFSDNNALELRSDIPEHLPNIIIDPDRLAQVLINLLHNATKFTTEGFVLISARATTRGTVQVRVKDTGPGIPQSDIPRIFDRFHQVAHADTLANKPKGTGLGLTICRQIIEQFGGHIWVESTFGHGSTFIFELPSTS